MWEKNGSTVKAVEPYNDCGSKLGTLESIKVFECDYSNHSLTQCDIKSSQLWWVQQVALSSIYMSKDFLDCSF